MLRAVPDDETLDDILAHVSRSFYLSLVILPRAVRAQLSIAYLVARAADTIADTRVVRPERRRELLERLRAGVEAAAAGGAGGDAALVADLEREVVAQEGGCTPREQLLLVRLDECLGRLAHSEDGDRQRARKVLATLIEGMHRDLARFPAPALGAAFVGEPVALASAEELETHAYFAAGCVGEYWTQMTAAHLPAVRRLMRPDWVARGVRLGKALQYVNVIRDTPRDLDEGRCYVPADLLRAHGMTPGELRDPVTRRRARPLLAALAERCLGHIDAAFPYVLAIPRTAPRLRLAALWPLWIGLATLERVFAVPDSLDPRAPVKIARADVYRVIAESSAVVASDTLLARSQARRRAAVRV